MLFSIGSFLALYLGDLQIPLMLLLAMMLLDYITAIGAAEKRGQKIASEIGIGDKEV